MTSITVRRLFFGGSFNPIHVGHLLCAAAAAEIAGFDRIVLVPNRQPPHKQGHTEIAAEADRLAMCRLAAAGDARFEVSEIELLREGPSYTIDSARELRRRGEPDIAWLIGADMAQYLPQWHEPAKLLAEVRFVLMARPGWPFDWLTVPAEYRHLERHVVQTPLIQISSTEIRQRVAAGKPINYMTTPAVVDYIREHGLYRRNVSSAGDSAARQ
jgi:nicotinate-nucleotide adenylyltransferase